MGPPVLANKSWKPFGSTILNVNKSCNVGPETSGAGGASHGGNIPPGAVGGGIGGPIGGPIGSPIGGPIGGASHGGNIPPGAVGGGIGNGIGGGGASILASAVLSVTFMPVLS